VWDHLPYLVVLWIFMIGLYGIISSRHLVHLIMCLNVVQSSTYLMLLAIGFRDLPSQAPIFKDIPADSPAVDPVVHALTLTDIVVGATIVALLLALAVEVQKQHNTMNPRQLRAFRQ
jgi:multicomponent Na+:H+ antiporter subunit C